MAGSVVYRWLESFWANRLLKTRYTLCMPAGQPPPAGQCCRTRCLRIASRVLSHRIALDRIDCVEMRVRPQPRRAVKPADRLRLRRHADRRGPCAETAARPLPSRPCRARIDGRGLVHIGGDEMEDQDGVEKLDDRLARRKRAAIRLQLEQQPEVAVLSGRNDPLVTSASALAALVASGRSNK